MKIFIIANIFSGVCLSYVLWTAASGQYQEDPTLFFKPFEFDTVLRGVYNVSECMIDLMQCMELVRPDIMCRYTPRHFNGILSQAKNLLISNDEPFEQAWSDTICPFLKEHCHDYFGDYNKLSPHHDSNYHMHWMVWENNCDTSDVNYTRRFTD